MKTHQILRTGFQQSGLIMLACVLLTGCASKIISGAAPMVRMSELSHENNKIKLNLNMRNPNGVELDIQSIDVSLKVDDIELFAYQGPMGINFVSNGTETWSMQIEESQNSRELLETLQSGDVKSLPYSLTGTVLSRDDGTLNFEHEGHIYPLPGRAGYFR